MARTLSQTPTDIEKIKNTKQRSFLKHYLITGGVIARAAKLANVDRRYHYKWLAEDEVYKAGFEQAEREAIDVLEMELHRRAIDGVDKPIIYKGEITGSYKEYSDILLMFLLKKKNPAYRDNFTQNIGIMGSGKVEVEFNIPRPPVN
jgi:hypothetical protein